MFLKNSHKFIFNSDRARLFEKTRGTKFEGPSSNNNKLTIFDPPRTGEHNTVVVERVFQDDSNNDTVISKCFFFLF